LLRYAIKIVFDSGVMIFYCGVLFYYYGVIV